MRSTVISAILRISCACLALALLCLPIAANAQQTQRTDPLQTDILLGYEVLIGAWRPDPAALPDGLRQWRAENNISENWVEFSWGPEQQWMRFGDWQRKDGVNRHAGAGLVAYDPAGHRVMFTEHSIRGASVIGTLARVSPTEIVRDIVISRTDRSWRQIDRWVWTDGDDRCFNWSISYINGANRTEQPATRWCRMAAMPPD